MLTIAQKYAAIVALLGTDPDAPVDGADFLMEVSALVDAPTQPAAEGTLPDVLSRARSVIEESDGADEHASLVVDLTIAEADAARLVALAQLVAAGNTDADRLAILAAAALAGEDAPTFD